MKYILMVLAWSFTAIPTWAAMDYRIRRCRDALHSTRFFKKAPDPVMAVTEFVEHMGTQALAMVGPESLRHRLDRAFFLYLLKKFEVLKLNVPEGTELRVNDRIFRVTTFTDQKLIVRAVGAPRPAIDWHARYDYASPTAKRALDTDLSPERADTWLDMDPDVGVELLGELIEAALPRERRIEIRTEIDAWQRYLEDVRTVFNRAESPLVKLGPDFKPRPKIDQNVH